MVQFNGQFHYDVRFFSMNRFTVEPKNDLFHPVIFFLKIFKLKRLSINNMQINQNSPVYQSKNKRSWRFDIAFTTNSHSVVNRFRPVLKLCCTHALLVSVDAPKLLCRRKMNTFFSFSQLHHFTVSSPMANYLQRHLVHL